MNEILRKIGLTAIAEDVLMIIFSLLIVNLKSLFIGTFVIVIAAFCILKGVVEICKFIIARGVSDFYKDDLFFGIAAIVFGVLFIIFKDQFFWMLRVSIGIYIVLAAIKSLYLSIKIRKYSLNEWIPMFIISVIMLITGIVIIMKKGIIIKLCATVMIIYSVLDIINSLLFIRGAKEIFKEE